MQIGILGAARIAPQALIKPAKANADVVVAAVAARDGLVVRGEPVKTTPDHVSTMTISPSNGS